MAGLGGKDHRDGSLAYYFSEPVVCNDAKGVGPLVLAYTEMIMATLAGWWFFGEMPDRWTFVGVAILIACAVYISVRERVRRVAVAREFEQP